MNPTQTQPKRLSRWRQTIRFCRFWMVLFRCAGSFVRRHGFRTRDVPRAQRTLWARKWASQFLESLGVSVRSHGAPPEHGLLVTNHLSYIDVLAVLQVFPTVFVAKSQIAKWPFIGFICGAAGTLFLDRERKRDLMQVASAFSPAVESGTVVTFFPEGTTSDGSTTLPFRASLFEPAAKYGWEVHAAHIHYAAVSGDASTEVCYWGDMKFLHHLFNICALPSIECELRFAQVPVLDSNRKRLAERSREVVDQLRREQLASN